MASEVLNVLTVDVEDYYQVSAFDSRVSRDNWGAIPSRVVANTNRLLDLFDQRRVKATFFVLGWIGKHFPGLVRQIVDRGHEVGCHSYWHRLIYQLTPDQFRDDTRLARDVLEDAAGTAVTAYRAPTFSITAHAEWALDILCELGFQIDSSIFPVRHDRYGMPGAQRYPTRIRRLAGELWEYPPTVARIGPWNVPVAGGGYFRLFPLRFTQHCFRQVNAANQAVMFYLHPWEIDPDQPRIPRRPWQNWRHYVNLDKTERKLDLLLAAFRFGTLREVHAATGRGVVTRPDLPDVPVETALSGGLS
jgi:polysaccharide deacetylase family protein (PEP-CTERM system associated)